MEARILRAEFLGSAGVGSPTPNKKKLPEVLVAGRSNVGKSTIINNLLKQEISYVSKTPGRTSVLNYFQVRYEVGSQQRNFCLVDTPGFGYAKVDFDKRAELSTLISTYFKESPHIKIGLVLNDIRRAPEDDELRLLKILAERQAHTLIVATKSDKLGTNDRIKQLKVLANSYGLEAADIFHTSLKPDLSQLINRIAYLLTL